MRRPTEFSKIIVAATMLFVYPTAAMLTIRISYIAEIAVKNGYDGTLPYLSMLIAPVWGAVATVLGFYFNKAKAENKEKIKREEKKDEDERKH